MKIDSSYSYSDWYVLQVQAKREYATKNVIEQFYSHGIKLLIFSREILHTKKGRKIKLTTPLFPGYIFLYKEIEKILRIKKYNLLTQFIKPVVFNGVPATVGKEEMRLLFSSSNTEGLFRLSQGYLADDGRVQITQGPLKDIAGKIIFINKKKRKVRVRLTLFNREVNVSLGLDLISSIQPPAPECMMQRAEEKAAANSTYI
jgi:transcriptional antiterminator NusG